MSKEKELEQAICNPLYAASGRKKVLETVIEKARYFQSDDILFCFCCSTKDGSDF